MTSMWTELLEYCEWDEEAAALLIEQVRYNMPPRPPENIHSLVMGMIQIASRPETNTSVADS